MSFEEPNDTRSSEIINNQIQLTELATYKERTPDLPKTDLLLKKITFYFREHTEILISDADVDVCFILTLSQHRAGILSKM